MNTNYVIDWNTTTVQQEMWIRVGDIIFIGGAVVELMFYLGLFIGFIALTISSIATKRLLERKVAVFITIVTCLLIVLQAFLIVNYVALSVFTVANTLSGRVLQIFHQIASNVVMNWGILVIAFYELMFVFQHAKRNRVSKTLCTVFQIISGIILLLVTILGALPAFLMGIFVFAFQTPEAFISYEVLYRLWDIEYFGATMYIVAMTLIFGGISIVRKQEASRKPIVMLMASIGIFFVYSLLRLNIIYVDLFVTYKMPDPVAMHFNQSWLSIFYHVWLICFFIANGVLLNPRVNQMYEGSEDYSPSDNLKQMMEEESPRVHKKRMLEQA